jgi:hypothetical protein
MNKPEIETLKRSVGRRPFEARLRIDGGGFCACPFHSGEGNKSMHLQEKPGGVWIATCFSSCHKSWDAINFVMEFDRIDFAAACDELRGGKALERETAVEEIKLIEEKQPRMTDEGWPNWGRPITAADVARFASSRKDKTAGLGAFGALNCRVRGDYIGFPNYYTTADGAVKYDLVRARHMDKKEILIEHKVSMHGLYNRDTVNALEDVYVVEGEPDVAIMEESGFRAVSVIAGAQKEFDRRAIKRLAKAARIFIVGDMLSGDDENDPDPGAACMDRLEGVLKAEVPDKVFRFTFDDAHDVSELATKPDFVERIERFSADATMPWVEKNIPLISQLKAESAKWTIDRLFPYGGLTMIAGREGDQKSLFALAAAKAISGATKPGVSIGMAESDAKFTPSPRKAFLGREIPRGCPVLYVDHENPESTVSERKGKLGIVARDNFYYWGGWEAGAKSVPQEIDDPRLVRFAESGGFIIFDSLQDWYNGASEIDNTAMVALMRKFLSLARKGAGVLVLHHRDKYGASAWRGATGIPAVTDMAIGISKVRDESDSHFGEIQLREHRFRMCGGWEMDFKFHFGTEYYEMQLVRDETLSQKVRHAEMDKRATIEAEEQAADEVAAKIAEKPSRAASTLAEIMGVNHKKVTRLAALRGLRYDKAARQWVKETPPEEQAAISDSDSDGLGPQ